ncbi:nicotinate-nucleotide adenylyltransferase [Parashewanella curva]|uniref:Probable nicotinate-nucleotide adenylyltransferase n=1 Tax=Parashewanella curva TaxID=2338552 RepID=A0A3L8PXJ5_9GAMM|nr:nicotinate-nucleotide adenylyltransferase [Parashewanella curva]RLV60136.1 nicotinate-nucleotide adenylyltransferase [Parashewanella curva]
MRIGILGGTFDPIHYGHICPALEVKEKLGLDKIWLMPNHIPPHKQSTHASTEDRIKMVELVCEEYSEFELCDIELKRDTPSYSVQTLAELKQAHPSHHFVFLMGTDSLLSLHTWHQYEQLFELCDIAVTQRPDYTYSAQIKGKIARRFIKNHYKLDNTLGNIFLIPVKPKPISSTFIRNQLQQNEDCSQLFPLKVRNYIDSKSLYLSNTRSDK